MDNMKHNEDYLECTSSYAVVGKEVIPVPFRI